MNKLIGLLEKVVMLLQEQELSKKQLMSVKEAASYLNLDEQTLYNFNRDKKIPHYKPNGKKVYYKRDELDDWVFQNRIPTSEEKSSEVEQEFENVESFLASNSKSPLL